MAIAIGVLMAKRNIKERIRISVVTTRPFEFIDQESEAVDQEDQTTERDDTKNNPFRDI